VPLAARASSLPPSSATRLPWFGTISGHTLVPAVSSGGDAIAVLTLLEGGELSVHDLSAPGGPGDAAAAAAAQAVAAADAAGAGRSRGFRARFQTQPKVTAACLRAVPTAHVPLQGMQVGRPQRRGGGGN
jgi:hypothetical protein